MTQTEQKQNYELVQYKIDENKILKVAQFDETVWLTQNQMAEMFEVGRAAITKHINNIYKDCELSKKGTCSKMEHMGNNKQKYIINYYNLDVIISVGYRVKSKRGVQFRQWATKVIKDRIKQEYSKQQAFSKADVEKLLTLKKECANLINRALRANGFSQAQIGRELGLNSTTVSNSINGVHYNHQVFQWIKDNIFANADKSSLLENLQSTYKFSDHEMNLLVIFFMGGRFLREQVFSQLYKILKYDSFDKI